MSDPTTAVEITGNGAIIIGILVVAVQFLVAMVGWFMVTTLRRVDATLYGVQQMLFTMHGRLSRLEGLRAIDDDKA